MSIFLLKNVVWSESLDIIIETGDPQKSVSTLWYTDITIFWEGKKSYSSHTMILNNAEFLIFKIFLFIFTSWRLITLQYCSGFCHTLTWISHGFTCVPHPDPPSRLPLHPIPLGLPSAPALSTCLMMLNFLKAYIRKLHYCLGRYGLLQQHTKAWAAYKQHLFLTILKAGESRIEVPAWSCPWWGHSFWFIVSAFLLCPHMVEGSLLDKTLTPHDFCPSQRPHFLTASSLEVRISTNEIESYTFQLQHQLW